MADKWSGPLYIESDRLRLQFLCVVLSSYNLGIHLIPVGMSLYPIQTGPGSRKFVQYDESFDTFLRLGLM